MNQPPPPDAEISQGASHVDYEHGQALLRTGTNGTANGIIAATSDVGGMSRDGSSGSARTISAMHSLMDQGLCHFRFGFSHC